MHYLRTRLDEESILKVKENRQSRFNKEVQKGKELVQKVNELKKTLSEMPEVKEINRDELLEIEDKLMELQMAVKASEQFKILMRIATWPWRRKNRLEKNWLLQRQLWMRSKSSNPNDRN